MQQQCFIAVATGQNVANLPPILQRAQPGDVVLWLESEKAQKGKWSAGSSEVLGRFRIGVLEPLLIPDDPAQIAAALDSQRNRWGGYTPVVVLNGGTKLTAIALYHFFGSDATYLYGADNPAELWIFNGGLDKPHRREDYGHPFGTLTLENILACSGHLMVSPKEARRFWPGDEPLTTLNSGYGTDVTETEAVHDRVYEANFSDRRTEAGNIGYDAVQKLVPDHFRKWLRSCMVAFNAARRWPRRLSEPPEESVPGLKQVFHSTLNLHAAALSAASAPSRSIGERNVKLGPIFEVAVANRVLRYLNGDPQCHRFLESAWHGVKVASAEDPGTVVAELDIVLVLRNGLLLSLECKSFQADKKDLDARLRNLHRVASRLAKMAVCAPLYSHFTKRGWFAAQHQLREYVTRHTSMRFIPFTLPEQPTHYDCPPPGTPDTGSIEAGSFESAFASWIVPYCPKAG